jgi:hypothetical protein
VILQQPGALVGYAIIEPELLIQHERVAAPGAIHAHDDIGADISEPVHEHAPGINRSLKKGTVAKGRQGAVDRIAGDVIHAGLVTR